VVWRPVESEFLVGGSRGVIATVPWPNDGSGRTLRAASRGWSPSPRIALSPDGEAWAASFETELELWNGSELIAKVSKPEGYLGRLAFDSRGERLISSADPATLWNVPDLAIEHSWPARG